MNLDNCKTEARRKGAVEFREETDDKIAALDQYGKPLFYIVRSPYDVWFIDKPWNRLVLRD